MAKAKPTQRPRIFTVGHSNHPIAEFIELLESQRLKLLVDVRTIPKSRHNPQFGAARLKQSLKRKGIEYIYLAELGGLRRVHKDSINTAWENSSFRAYADHMQTEEFAKGIKRLLSLAKRKRLAIMCAEALPWRCHRRMIADALLVRGHPVADIFSKSAVKTHTLTSFAKVGRGGRITYPKE